MTLSRLLLTAVFWDRVAATGGLGFILLQGLRFDIVAIGLLFGPLFVLTPLLGRYRWFHAISRAYLLIALTAGAFVELSSLTFIQQYDARPNDLFLEYLAYPKEVLATLTGGFLPELLAVIALVAVFAWLSWRITRPGPSREYPYNWWATPLLTFLMLLMVVAMIRSTLDHRPVNPSTVAFSADAMVNQLALNSPYSLLYAAYEQRRDDIGNVRYGEVEEEEAIRLVLDEAGIANHLADQGSPSMHLQSATRHFARPLNIVIVLEESLGAEFVGGLGGLNLTPNLDRLANDGIWLEQLYATGTRSVRGIEAVVTGFTPTPRRSVVKLAQTQERFFTLAGLLADQGYRTSFIYGGEAHFDNMARFFLNNGFQEVVDERDYENPVYTAAWGVSDEDLFTRAHQQFSQAGQQPFFSLVFTSSNHDPFDIPADRVEKASGEEAERHTAIKYADYALGRFIDEARRSSYWQDTVFLVIADHNSRTYGDQLVPVERFHIPGLFLGGTIEPRRVPGITSQIDMLPTLLSLAGVDATHPAIGRDLTRPEFMDGAGRAIMQFNAIQAYMEPGHVIVLQAGLEPLPFLCEPGGSLLPNPDPDSARIRRALAYAAWGPLEISHHYYFNQGDATQPRALPTP